jgi:hypothetical protein
VLFEHVLWYRPRPLQMRMHEWVSPVAISLRDLDVAYLEAGRQMGRQVIDALGFQAGFTHMEWYRKPDGEVVFGEIGARPPGARVTDLMNFNTDGDVYVGWADAVVHGRMPTLERRYNVGSITKRARGLGHITGVSGLDPLLEEYAADVVLVDLLPVGSPRRDWRATTIADGIIIVRHPDLQRVIEMTEHFAADVQLHAQ